MRAFLIILLFISSIKDLTQNQFNSNNLSVTRSDLETNTFVKDSTANALIIYELGNSYVDKRTFKLITEVKKKIKILNRKGFENAKVVIYLYNNDNKNEKVSKISATTFNLENDQITKVQLEKNQIFEEKYNDNYTIIKFAFPNIKEGSVITYSYTLETPFMFKYRDWYFQQDIPKLYSQYDTSIPGNYDYNIKLVGFLKLDLNTFEIEKNCLEIGSGGSADCITTSYVMKDIPAFVEEEFATTKTNYLSRLEYELKTFKGFDGRIEHYTKTWETVDLELKNDKNIGRQLKKSSATNGLLDASISNDSDILSKAKSIFKFVQQTYTWNERFNIFNEVSIKDLIEKKSGNLSEINILLHNLLTENGIDVKPILLSTRHNGFATKLFPVLSEFNYTIVQATIDGKIYLLDATDDYVSFGQLPFRCLNQYGRLLDFKDGSSWIDIDGGSMSSIQYKISVKIDSGNVLRGSINKTNTGYHALIAKADYFKSESDYFKSFIQKYSAIEFIEHEVFTKDKTEDEFREEFIISMNLDNVGDKIFLNPFLIKFFDKNFFRLQERTYPIDFGFKDAYLYQFKLEIDDSFEVLEVPKDLTIHLPDNGGTIIFSNKVENNTIQLYMKFSFKEAIYNPEFYPYIKSYMESIIDIQKNTVIVLKKK